MPNTPIYGFPYETVNDPPHGPARRQALAEAVENTVKTVDDRVLAVEGPMPALVQLLPGPWQNAVLQNGWVPFSGGYGTPGFRLRGGYVDLRGTMRSGTSADGTVLFTLPSGYRPSWTQQITIRAEAAANTFVEISTAGPVSMWFGSGTNALTIDGISFPLT